MGHDLDLGDFRYLHTDDQAAQVLVAFADRHILTYIWDSSAPKGSWQSAGHVPLIRIFALVCRSGPEELNRWVPETHNVAQDYQKAFEMPAAREDHRNIVLVRRGNHFFVADGTAGLDDCGCTSFDCCEQAINEREEGVGRHR